MERFSSSEYYQEITSLAEEIVRECEGDREASYDRAHETVDSHRWIIYTYYNGIVLEHSSNDNAYFEEYGALEADGYSDAMVKMAFAAMHRDLCEAIETALGEYEPEEEESTDD